MRPYLARFSEPVRSGHLPSWADFITATPELKFLVHTTMAVLKFLVQTGNALSVMIAVLARRTKADLMPVERRIEATAQICLALAHDAAASSQWYRACSVFASSAK
jgi:hypothetical protein